MRINCDFYNLIEVHLKELSSLYKLRHEPWVKMENKVIFDVVYELLTHPNTDTSCKDNPDYYRRHGYTMIHEFKLGNFCVISFNKEDLEKIISIYLLQQC